ncbi:hydroxyacid dehydrogenase [Bosea sp. Root381]|uniref:D-2-hydroxyacid dehydrogenase family protein n=1 Tax=Bosea sp. Root381 TaxID=1736524 RepID=UPI0006FB5BC9|nr:D-2-hydroxyacid dehydrogenase family protein [Bosea sp. Root381]KRE18245.1 hydroxyacid dehydrogenase [Bosea sp. Root381]
MIRVAVLDDYQNVARRYVDWSSLGDDVTVDVFGEPLGSEEAAARLADYDVLCLMRERLPLPRSLIEKLPRLKLVVVTGGRVRVIDFDAAVAQGITVCHTSAGESEHATPELAWALILAAARHLPDEFQRMREGSWQQTIGTTLGGKTLGLIGLGKLGSRMAPIGRAFGMRVVAWSPNLTQEKAAPHGAEAVSKTSLFETSDAISIHIPGGAASKDLVGAAEIDAMKPGAILVNTSRGPIVNEAALLAALKEGRIRAGLDVYDIEPLPKDHPLRTAPNVVLSPHLGFVTEGAYRAFYQDTVDAIQAWRMGKPIRVLAAPGA